MASTWKEAASVSGVYLLQELAGCREARKTKGFVSKSILCSGPASSRYHNKTVTGYDIASDVLATHYLSDLEQDDITCLAAPLEID